MNPKDTQLLQNLNHLKQLLLDDASDSQQNEAELLEESVLWILKSEISKLRSRENTCLPESWKV